MMGYGLSTAAATAPANHIIAAANDTDADLRRNENFGIVPSSRGDEMFLRLRREAASVARSEPILAIALSKAGLLDDGPSSSSCAFVEPAASSFEEAISRIVSRRLSSCSGGRTESICPDFLRRLLEESFRSDDLEMGHTMAEAVREDAMAILRRDPACETLLEAVLFMKGFHSLVIHRAARRAWRPVATKKTSSEAGDDANAEEEGGGGVGGGGRDDDPAPLLGGKRFVALLLQSLASSAFGVDIHPASSIGAGIMIDHATGVVIGETASVGDGTTILHGVASLLFLLVASTPIFDPPPDSLTIFCPVKTDPRRYREGERRPSSEDREARSDRGGHPDPREHHRGRPREDRRRQRRPPSHPWRRDGRGGSREDHRFHGQGRTTGQFRRHEVGGSGAAFGGHDPCR
jgi:serine acetyltransferase